MAFSAFSNDDSTCGIKLPFFHYAEHVKFNQQIIQHIAVDALSCDPILLNMFASENGWLPVFGLFAYLLSRYSAQNQLQLAIQIENPDKEAFLRGEILLNLSEEQTFDNFLVAIEQATRLQSDVESAIPIEPLVAAYKAGQFERSPQVLFYAERQNDPLTELTTTLKQIESQFQQNSETTDLVLVCVYSKTQLHLELLYQSAHFEKNSMHLLAEHVKQLCLNYAENYLTPLKNISYLTLAEHQQLAKFCCGESRDFSQLPMHMQIEKFAVETPQNVAVKFASQSLSYRELNLKANQLAHFLMGKGIKSGNKIVVMVDPGFDIVVAMLAIFKLNATYVPIDPSFPKQRITTIVNDVAPAAVITLGCYGALFESVSIFELESINTELGRQNEQNPQCKTNLDETAYIYYTSGTTGNPKGVMASYANLINYLSSAQQVYGIAAGDVMASCARFTFSISMFELMFPLCHGATLQLLTREHILDLEKMAVTLQQLTFLHMGPSLLKLLLGYIKDNYSDLNAFQSVRHISSGGDLVPPEVIRTMQELFPSAEHYVIYGCSEISCMGCTWRVPTDKPVVKTFVGSPFSNTQVLLLDHYDHPVPVGIPGQICFSGEGVVKGYLNNPALTAEKFFNYQGKRFYRTGDLGKLSAQGELEILGRADFQIQLNGIRIEPTEIEFYIKQHPQIKDCVVTLSGNETSKSTLVAYYVSMDSHELAASELKQFIAQFIPEYMLPSLYIRLDALPLNFNLKVDRKVLIQRKIATEVFHRGVAPQSELEQKLADIWAEILSIDFVSRDDNFFEIGGDSLSAVMMTMSVKRQLELSIYGLDVARETLAVIARKLSGEEVKLAVTRQPESAKNYQLQTLFFGDKQELFGVYFQPNSIVVKSPVLICPPVGQEHYRCEFILKKISRELAAQGHPVFLFDHFGSGNSQGLDIEASLSRWQSDQLSAMEYLQHRSARQDIVVLAIRLGGSLALETFADSSLKKLVLWDPIFSGENYLKSIKRSHSILIRKARVIKLFKHWFKHFSDNQMLGFHYSDSLVDSIKKLNVLPRLQQLNFPVTGVLSKGGEMEVQDLTRQTSLNSQAEWIFSKDDCSWYDVSQTEKAITNHGIAKIIMQHIVESNND